MAKKDRPRYTGVSFSDNLNLVNPRYHNNFSTVEGVPIKSIDLIDAKNKMLYIQDANGERQWVKAASNFFAPEPAKKIEAQEPPQLSQAGSPVLDNYTRERLQQEAMLNLAAEDRVKALRGSLMDIDVAVMSPDERLQYEKEVEQQKKILLDEARRDVMRQSRGIGPEYSTFSGGEIGNVGDYKPGYTNYKAPRIAGPAENIDKVMLGTLAAGVAPIAIPEVATALSTISIPFESTIASALNNPYVQAGLTSAFMAGAAQHMPETMQAVSNARQELINDPSWYTGVNYAGELGKMGLDLSMFAPAATGIIKGGKQVYDAASNIGRNIADRYLFVQRPDTWTRGIGMGREGLDDAIRTGVIRGNPNGIRRIFGMEQPTAAGTIARQNAEAMKARAAAEEADAMSMATDANPYKYHKSPFNGTDLLTKHLYSNYINGIEPEGYGFKQTSITQGLSEGAVDNLVSRVINRNIREMRKAGVSEEEIQAYVDRTNKAMSNVRVGRYTEKDYNLAGEEEVGGFYNKDNNFISINEGNRYPDGYVEKHEGDHLIDHITERTERQKAAMEEALGDDFRNMPNTEYAGSERWKNYDWSHDMGTTVHDARDRLLDEILAESDEVMVPIKDINTGTVPIIKSSLSLEEQDALIDSATDEQIFRAFRKSNNYGRRFMRYMKDAGKLTPKKAEQFRTVMKEYGFKDKYGREVTPTPYSGTDEELTANITNAQFRVLQYEFSPEKAEQLKKTMGWTDKEIAEYRQELLRNIGHVADVEVKGVDDGFLIRGQHAGRLVGEGENMTASHKVTLNRDRTPDNATATEAGIHEIGGHGRTASIEPSDIGIEGDPSTIAASGFPRTAEIMRKNHEIAQQTLVPNEKGRLFEEISKQQHPTGELEKWLYENNIPQEQWQSYFNDFKYWKYMTTDQDLIARGYTGQIYKKIDPSRKTENIKQLELFYTPESVEKYKNAVLSVTPWLVGAGTAYGVYQGNNNVQAYGGPLVRIANRFDDGGQEFLYDEDEASETWHPFWIEEMTKEHPLWNTGAGHISSNYLPEITVSPSQADIATTNAMREAIPDYLLRNEFYDYITNNGGIADSMIDQSISDKDRADRFLKLYNASQRPIISLLTEDDAMEGKEHVDSGDLRSYYVPSDHTMYLAPNTYSPYDSNAIAELTHAYQYFSPDSNKHWLTPSPEKMLRQDTRDADALDENGMNSYDLLGNTENTAHFIMQPAFESYINGRKEGFLGNKPITDYSGALHYYTHQAVSRFRDKYPQFEDPDSSFKLTNTDKVRAREYGMQPRDIYAKHVEPDWDVLDRMGFSTPYNGLITKYDQKAPENFNILKEPKGFYKGGPLIQAANMFKKGGPKKKKSVLPYYGIYGNASPYIGEGSPILQYDADSDEWYSDTWSDDRKRVKEEKRWYKAAPESFRDNYKMIVDPYGDRVKYVSPEKEYAGSWKVKGVDSGIGSSWSGTSNSYVNPFEGEKIIDGRIVWPEEGEFAVDGQQIYTDGTDDYTEYELFEAPNYAGGGQLETPRKWNDLSVKEKADMMKVAIRNGITDLSAIKDKYNEFADGGNIYARGSQMTSGSYFADRINKMTSGFYNKMDELSDRVKKMDISYLTSTTPYVASSQNSVGKVSGGGQKAVQYAINFFVNKGLARHQAIGLVANLYRESNLNPGIYNREGSGAFGLAQWLGDRKSALFARYGKNPSFQDQLENIWHELNTTHKKGLQMLRSSRNVDEAAANAFGYYEFSAGPAGAVASMNKWGQDGQRALNMGIGFARQFAGLPVDKNAQYPSVDNYENNYVSSIPDTEGFNNINNNNFVYDPLFYESYLKTKEQTDKNMEAIAHIQVMMELADEKKAKEAELAQLAAERAEKKRIQNNNLNFALNILGGMGQSSENSNDLVGMFSPFFNNIAACGGSLNNKYDLGGPKIAPNGKYRINQVNQNFSTNGSFFSNKMHHMNDSLKRQALVKAGMTPNEAEAFMFYVNKGMTPAGAAGMVGQLVRESNVNPGVVNKDSGAYGAFQFLGPRKSKLLGLDNYDTLPVQLNYSWSELSSPVFKNAYSKLYKATDPLQAASDAFNYYMFLDGDGIRAMNSVGQNGNVAYAMGRDASQRLYDIYNKVYPIKQMSHGGNLYDGETNPTGQMALAKPVYTNKLMQTPDNTYYYLDEFKNKWPVLQIADNKFASFNTYGQPTHFFDTTPEAVEAVKPSWAYDDLTKQQEYAKDLAKTTVKNLDKGVANMLTFGYAGLANEAGRDWFNGNKLTAGVKFLSPLMVPPAISNPTRFASTAVMGTLGGNAFDGFYNTVTDRDWAYDVAKWTGLTPTDSRLLNPGFFIGAKLGSNLGSNVNYVTSGEYKQLLNEVKEASIRNLFGSKDFAQRYADGKVNPQGIMHVYDGTNPTVSVNPIRFFRDMGFKNALNADAYNNVNTHHINVAPTALFFKSPRSFKGTLAHEFNHSFEDIGKQNLSAWNGKYYGPSKEFSRYDLIEPFEEAAAKGYWDGNPGELGAEMYRWGVMRQLQKGEPLTPYRDMSPALKLYYNNKVLENFGLPKDKVSDILQGLSDMGYFSKGGRIHKKRSK